jgi:hypothetical protein
MYESRQTAGADTAQPAADGKTPGEEEVVDAEFEVKD